MNEQMDLFDFIIKMTERRGYVKFSVDSKNRFNETEFKLNMGDKDYFLGNKESIKLAIFRLLDEFNDNSSKGGR